MWGDGPGVIELIIAKALLGAIAVGLYYGFHSKLVGMPTVPAAIAAVVAALAW